MGRVVSAPWWALAPLGALVLGVAACEDEDQRAKARLSAPADADPVAALAQQPIDTEALANDAEVLRRVCRMRFSEIKARLGSLKYASKATLAFQRGAIKIDSAEDVQIVQSRDGDFSVRLVTGDGSRQELAYANGILFLKNNNGKWRASRDPTGERTTLVEDSAGVWRAFFGLLETGLKLKKMGVQRRQGREVVDYAMTAPDLSSEARALGKGKPEQRVEESPVVDGGIAIEDTPATLEKKKKTMRLLSAWRDNARPAGGQGKLVVDKQTGVIVALTYKGRMVVGDAPTPAELNVNIQLDITNIGKDLRVHPPKSAVDEIVRKKWPVHPRALLEKNGLVPKRAPKDPADAKAPAAQEKTAPPSPP